MNLEHMRRLCGWHFRVLGAAILEGYEFGPDMRGYANIRPSAGDKVYGVLYELDEERLSILDDFEGYPNVFNRIEVEVSKVGASGNKYITWVYLEKPEQFGGSYVKEDYLKRVIIGARENRLPEAWIEKLESYL
ncbi:MAG: gamma-glutamylcyclotransferase [Candidatus Doudnabacteria bacterium]|nr:gamma-glutamylcyclotransferase [Candidatus Doudnabacteria bacterium]